MQAVLKKGIYPSASHGQLSGESSSEEQLEDSLDEIAMMDSGISEVSSEVSTVSVSEEIKRFQQEINAVAVENVKYPSWKQQRLGEKTRSASSGESFIDSDLDSEQQRTVDLPPRGGSILLDTKLPPKRKTALKTARKTAQGEAKHKPGNKEIKQKIYVQTKKLEKKFNIIINSFWKD